MNAAKRRDLLIVLVLLGVLRSTDGLAQTATEPKWDAALYAADPSWLQVRVDTKGLAPNEVAREVKFSVGYLDSNGDLLGGRSYDFTSGSLVALEAGRIYQQFFQNPYSGAASAEGYSLQSSLTPLGEFFERRTATSRSHSTIFEIPRGHPPVAALAAEKPAYHSGSAVMRVISVEHGQAAPALVAPPTPPLTFTFPGGGVRNANRTIGPFCCTGETATVLSSSGTAVGYIYFLAFPGAKPLGSSFAAPQLRILLSANSLEAKTPGEQVQGVAVFNAANWSPNQSRNVPVGALSYAVTLNTATVVIVNGQRMFSVPSARATVVVTPPH